MAQFTGQTSTNLDTEAHFSTKRTAVSTIRKASLSTDREFCTCVQQCVPPLKVFTDQVGTDTLKNDWTSFFIPTVNKVAQSPAVVGSTISAKIIDQDSGTETTLSDPTHGELKQGQLYWWFKLDWYLVYSALGYGRYKITVTESGIISGETISTFESPIYRLMPYTDRNAHGTVVIESTQTGKLHHGNNYANLTTSDDFTTVIPFEQRRRLPGELVAIDGETENDHLVLNTENRPSYQIKDQVRPKYRLELYLLEGKQIAPVVFDDLFGSPLYITDYNVYNHILDPRDYQANQLVQIPLLRGSYKIGNDRRGVKRKTYQFDMVYDYDNVFKTGN